MIKKFAEELKEERLKRDIPLSQVSQKTRIDIKFLEAIENGNFEILPEVYLKAFIKDYARVIGLDEETVVKRYEAAKSGRQYDARHDEASGASRPSEHRREETPSSHRPVEKPSYERPHQPEKPAHETPRHEKKQDYISSGREEDGLQDENTASGLSKTTVFSVAAAAILIIIVAAVYFLFLRDSSSEIITEKPYDEVLSENRERYETEDTTAQQQQQNQQAAPAASDSLELKIRSEENTWVRVLPDASRAGVEFVLAPQTERTIRAKRGFRIIIGNSGSAQLFLQGRQLDFTGVKGRSRSLTVDSTGAITYLRSETRKKQDTVKSDAGSR